MKRFFFAAVAIFITLTSFSQVLKPVKWSFSTNKLNETEAELIFKAKMDQGWHLYSQHIPEAEIRPVPTFFKINVTKDFKLVGKVLETSKGIEEYDKNFEMNLKYFSGTAIF